MPRSERANLQIRDEAVKRILDAARRVFAESGSAATMAEIAVEAGVSQGLAYRYFPSKEALLTRLVEEAANSGGGPAVRVRRIEGTPGERLALLISYILKDRQERPEFYQFLHQVLADEAVAPELREVVRENGRVVLEEIRRMIVEGQATGEVARDDPDQLMAALVAVFDGVVRRVPPADSDDPRAHFPEARIILRLLRPDSRRAEIS
jgi:AcrR family transcriptional regulator